ncbi:MAG: CBS domain-containing protein [Nanoarchaeota archaeon]|nr:CBS domain-containing protein [Nanoarchaeota archaeon]
MVSPLDIAKRRKALGISMPELAQEAGVSREMLKELEAGNPHVEVDLARIYQALDRLEEKVAIRVRDIMTHDVILVNAQELLSKAAKLLKTNNISQAPVIENGKIVGTITEVAILEKLIYGMNQEEFKDVPVNEVMERPLPMVPDTTLVTAVLPTLKDHPAVVVSTKGTISGIVSRSDVLEFRKR